MSCGTGHRHGLDAVLLWCRLIAVAPNEPLAWELPYATDATLKSGGEKKERKEKQKMKCGLYE